MYKGKKIAVVIPAHNEEKFIKDVILNIPDYIDKVIVVDDFSSDKTSETVKSINNKNVTLVRNETNLGVGGATLRGFEIASNEKAYDILMKIDADGQMPLNNVPNFLDAIVDNNYDYVKGNRFINTITLNKMPKLRLFGNIVLTFLNKLASGYWNIFDPQNGFLAIKTEVYANLDIHRLYKRYFFENDMLVQLNIHNARVKDIAIETIYGDEESGVNIFYVTCVFPFLFIKRFAYRIYQKYILRDFSPIALFLFIGAALLFFGVIFGAVTWYKSISYNTYASTGTVMLSVLPTVLGADLLLQAMVLDINNTPR